MNGPPMEPFTPRPTLEMPPVWGPGAPPPEAVNPPKKGPQDFVVYHDNTIPLWSQWDVPTALAALDNHQLGQFHQSSLLADAMGIDDSFDAVVQTRVLGLISRPFELRKSRKGHGNLARKALNVVRDLWDELFPEDVLASLLRSYLLMGFSPAQQIWRYDGKYLVPQIQVWHAGSIYFDSPTRTYVANAMEGPVYIRPGDGRWVLLTPFGSYRGWMQGAVRSVVVPFLARQYALRDWARYNEIHGLPIKLLKVPVDANADDKQNFMQQMADLGNESAVLLPQGLPDAKGSGHLNYDVELLEAKADTYEAFKDLTTKCEERIAIRLLGQNLTTNVDAGSLAAANVHDRVRLDYTRFDAKALGALREQVLRAFCQFNFGDPDVAPELVWNCTPPEDKSHRAKAMADLSTAAMNFDQIGAPIDLRELLKRADIATLPIDDIEEAADQKGQIYPYHLQYGVLTVNEIRARLGLAPRDGGDEPPKPLAAPAPAGGGPGKAGPSGAESERKEAIAGKRILIAGGPRTGKSFAADYLSNTLGLDVQHTDDLIRRVARDRMQDVVADWITEPGPWCIEGVTIIRALRKWLARNPDGSPADILFYGATARVMQNDGQRTMHKGIDTVWRQICADVIARGVRVLPLPESPEAMLEELAR